MADPTMTPVTGGREIAQEAEAQYQLACSYRDREDGQELAAFWFGRAARQGHAEAMFRLGRMIDGGKGPVRDAAQAVLWYRKAAALGYDEAQAELGSRPPRPVELSSQLEMAVAGDGRSQYQMGFAHMMGTGAPKDYVLSYFWFKVLEKTMPAQASQLLEMAAARLDDERMQAHLDELAEVWTPGTPPPTSDRMDRLRMRATLDDAPACYELGKALEAVGLPEAGAEALEWFVWAAKEGHVPSHYAMAFHYHRVGDEAEAERHLRMAGSRAPAELVAEGAAQGINRCRCDLAARLAREEERDLPRIAGLYRSAADEGYVPAMAGLAACYFNGYGVERDWEQAEHWFAEGARHEDAEALYGLGAIHRNRGLKFTRDGVVGSGGADAALRDHELACGFFERAAAKGHMRALYQLSLAYKLGEGVEKDPDRMREIQWKLAARGHTESQYLLGNYYASGEGQFEQDDEQAVCWYEQAAQREHPGATFRLAAHTLEGRGIEKDWERGWELTEKAARLGSVDAMVALAAMIDAGDGAESDPEAALDWYRKAADKGNAEAQYALGLKVMESDGPGYARQLLEQAAKQGHEKAQALLEKIAAEEKARPQPQQQPAASWSNDPMARSIAGDTNAQMQLGFAHYSGVGAARSLPLSYFWLKIVERSMPMVVTQMLSAIGAQLDAGQRAELERLAAGWTPGTPPPSA